MLEAIRVRRKRKNLVDIFSVLPMEIVCEVIFSYLPESSVLVISLTNKAVFGLCNCDLCWETLFRSKYGDVVEYMKMIPKKSMLEKNWKDRYKVMYRSSKECQEKYDQIYKCYTNIKMEFASLQSIFPFSIKDDFVLKSDKECFFKFIRKFQEFKTVKLYTQNGEIYYEGGMVDGKKEGYGEFTVPGRSYRGMFKNDLFHGKGFLKIEIGRYEGEKGFSYEGDYKNGREHGEGKIRYGDGSKYVGQWKDGMYDGNGKLTYPDGTFFQGNFKEYHYNGKGILDGKESNHFFDGEWEYDHQNEEYTFYGKITNKDNGEVFKGKWLNGRCEKHPGFFFHTGSYCDNCFQCPILGSKKFVCRDCFNYCLCENCHSKGVHEHESFLVDLEKKKSYVEKI